MNKKTASALVLIALAPGGFLVLGAALAYKLYPKATSLKDKAVNYWNNRA